jgi:protein-S-isoprenylcysteine O-methyltransferase Ste14
VVQGVVVGIFAFFISDFRFKKGMTPLLNQRIARGVKLLYPLLLVGYLYVLITLTAVFALDLVALALTTLGTFVVVKGKLDLGTSHTWAGYKKAGTELVTHGIYAYIRHPMYTGICLFILGTVITVVLHAAPILSVPLILATTLIVIFLVRAASEETRALEREFGEAFRAYRKRTHASIPFVARNK